MNTCPNCGMAKGMHGSILPGFVPSVKAPDAVPPPQMSIWEREAYVPDKTGYVRAGANDFLKLKSRGM